MIQETVAVKNIEKKLRTLMFETLHLRDGMKVHM